MAKRNQVKFVSLDIELVNDSVVPNAQAKGVSALHSEMCIAGQANSKESMGACSRDCTAAGSAKNLSSNLREAI